MARIQHGAVCGGCVPSALQTVIDYYSGDVKRDLLRAALARGMLLLPSVRAGAAGALLLVAGCSVRQPPELAMPASVGVPDTWASQSEANLQIQDLPTGWLAEFGDPRLEAIVAEALEHNQDLQTAAAQLEVARQAAIKAGAGLYPFMSFGAGGSSEGDYEGGDTTTTSGVSLDVIWEVDLWGGIRAGKAAGLADFEAAGSQYAFAAPLAGCADGQGVVSVCRK